MGGSEIQARLPLARKMVPLTHVFAFFFRCFSCHLSFSVSLSLFHTPPCQETTPAVPESPVSHLAPQVSAATGLWGHGLGTPRLPQLAKGSITVLNARAHPLGVELTWERGERSGWVPWKPLAPTFHSHSHSGQSGPHLSRSCSGWCGHTSGKPPPRSPL